jgi:hypothetical protein
VVSPSYLPRLEEAELTGYRLINSKYPPINLFDDVATEEEFDVAYALQALVNPRIQTEIGNLSLLSRDEIPFGIDGCSYATAPFTHVNPGGSRFSDGSYGMLYLADTPETAVAEVSYHQQTYWRNIPELKFDRFVFRELVAKFDTVGMVDATKVYEDDAIYDQESYTASHALGKALKEVSTVGLQFRSVRNSGATCWGLFTPKHVKRVIQTSHYEMIWFGVSAEIQVCRLNS